MDIPRKRGRPFAAGNHFGKARKAGSRNKTILAPGELREGEGRRPSLPPPEITLPSWPGVRRFGDVGAPLRPLSKVF